MPHFDQHPNCSSRALLEFEAVLGREPKAADMLSYEDVAGDRSVEFFGAFIDAWKRRLPGLVCPLKLQEGELHFRTLGGDGVGDGASELWLQKTVAGPQAR